MPKLNFEQKPDQTRDIGGPSGSLLLLIATALVVWMMTGVLHGQY